MSDRTEWKGLSGAVADWPWNRLEWLVIGFAALWPAASLAFGFVWDDHWLIETNDRLSAPGFLDAFLANVYRGYYWRPLTFGSFRLDWVLGGGAPFFFHLTNLGLNLALLLAARAFLTRLDWPVTLRTLLLLFWGVHPSRVETVAFISARDNLWLGIFIFLSLIALLEMARAEGRKRLAWGIGLWFCSLFALLSKEGGVVLPLAWVLFGWTWPPLKGRLTRVHWAVLLGSAVALWVPYGLLREAALKGGGENLLGSLDSIQILMPIFVFGKMIGGLLFPFQPVADDFIPTVWGAENWTGLLPAALVGGGFLVFWRVVRRVAPDSSAWALLFLATLGPVLNFIPTPGRLVSDTWLLVPGFFFLLFLFESLRRGLPALPSPRLARVVEPALAAGGLLFLVLSVVVSVEYLRVWENDWALYSDIIGKRPDNPRAYAWAGQVAMASEDMATCERLFTRGIEANSNYPNNYVGLALVHVSKQDRETARKLLEKAYDLEPDNEGAAYFLARLALDRRDLPETVKWATRTQKTAEYPERLLVLAEALGRMGEKQLGWKIYRQFCEIRPRNELCVNPPPDAPAPRGR